MILVKYDIFQLDISVSDLLAVQVAEGSSQLLDDLAALRFGKSLGGLLLERATQGYAGKELHYYV